MNSNLVRMVCVVAVTLFAVAPAYAQGSATTSLSGTVVDSGGGVIPGASVEVKNAAGTIFTAVTNSSGAFLVRPAQIVNLMIGLIQRGSYQFRHSAVYNEKTSPFPLLRIQYPGEETSALRHH